MKRYIKLTLYLVAIIAVAFVVDRAVGLPVEKILLPKQNDKYIYAYQGGKGEEVVIFGSSRAAHHYIPHILEDSLGVKCFNYGCDGQNIFNQYAILNLLLNHAETKPKVVILDIASVDILDSPNWDTGRLSVLHPYYSLDDSLKTVVHLQGKGTTHSLEWSRLYSFNSNIHNLLKPLIGIKNNDIENNGFLPINAKWENPLEIEIESDLDIDMSRIEYLRRFIKTCQKNSIKVILLISPHYAQIKGKYKWVLFVEEIAKECNSIFINLEQDLQFLQKKGYFYDPLHLNVDGATLYTNKLIPFIRESLQ